MRIVYLANAGSVHFIRWYEYFLERDHEIHLISGDTSQINHTVQLDPRIKVYYLPEKKMTNRIFSFVYNFLFTEHRINRLLLKLLNEIKPDIVHAHQLLPYGYWGVKTEFRPLVVTPIGSDAIIYAQKYAVYRKRARVVYENSDAITQDSHVCQQAGYKVGAKIKNNHIIQNGVDTDKFLPRLDGDAFKKEIGIDKDYRMVTHTRGLSDTYNMFNLLQAWKTVSKKMPDVRLFLVYFKFGKDNEDQLRKFVAQNGMNDSVIFHGFLPHDEMPRLYSASELSLSVPITDSSPSSVYEAMACGVPVVVSDLPWTNYAMRNMENCFIVPGAEPDKIAGAITEILGDNQLATRLGENGRRLVKEKFDYRCNMEAMEKIMQDAIARYRLPRRKTGKAESSVP